MPSLDTIRRTMCCPSGVCCSPGACYADDRTRSQLVDIDQAARAVVAVIRDEWRTWPRGDGPMGVTRHYLSVDPVERAAIRAAMERLP